MPRHFRIVEQEDDDILFVVDQDGNTIETYSMGERDGLLTFIGIQESSNNPTFIGIL